MKLQSTHARKPPQSEVDPIVWTANGSHLRVHIVHYKDIEQDESFEVSRIVELLGLEAGLHTNEQTGPFDVSLFVHVGRLVDDWRKEPPRCSDTRLGLMA